MFDYQQNVHWQYSLEMPKHSRPLGFPEILISLKQRVGITEKWTDCLTDVNSTASRKDINNGETKYTTSLHLGSLCEQNKLNIYCQLEEGYRCHSRSYVARGPATILHLYVRETHTNFCFWHSMSETVISSEGKKIATSSLDREDWAEIWKLFSGARSTWLKCGITLHRLITHEKCTHHAA